MILKQESALIRKLSRRSFVDWNPQPIDHECSALPLSYPRSQSYNIIMAAAETKACTVRALTVAFHFQQTDESRTGFVSHIVAHRKQTVQAGSLITEDLTTDSPDKTS